MMKRIELLFLLFLLAGRIYCDTVICQDNNITFIIRMTSLPNRFFLERIYRVLCFEGENIIDEYSDLYIGFDECEEYFLLKVKDLLPASKYLFSFYGGYIILYVENDEICNIVTGFY